MDLSLQSLDAQRQQWQAADYQLPEFDVEAMRRNTEARPQWIHFGGGNIFHP